MGTDAQSEGARKRQRPDVDEGEAAAISVQDKVEPKADTAAAPAAAAVPAPLGVGFNGDTPLDDIMFIVADLVFAHVQRLADQPIEIEAKLGTLKDRYTESRIVLPVSTETVFESANYGDGRGVYFESDMSKEAHRHFNQLLNAVFRRSQASESSAMPGQKMRYQHTREVDSFYRTSAGRVRITRDKATQKLLACVVKRRVVNLDIYCPRSRFDWRLSINLEVSADPSLAGDGPPEFTRQKDRISYRVHFYQIDLTMVKQDNARESYELEIEMMEMPNLKDQVARASRGEPSSFRGIMQGFVHSIRTLVQN